MATLDIMMLVLYSVLGFGKLGQTLSSEVGNAVMSGSLCFLCACSVLWGIPYVMIAKSFYNMLLERKP